MTGFSLRTARETDYGRLLPICNEFYSELNLTEAFDNISSTLKEVLAREDTAAFHVESTVEIIGSPAVSMSHDLEVSPYCELEDLFVLLE